MVIREDLAKNWGNYLKVGGILLAASLWGFTANAKINEHVDEMKDSVKLLKLICKNTSHTPADAIDCYTILEDIKASKP